ncbi:hypothetical protein [Streptococcus parauberis]|uniref:hypothetical protein n=1 Tax=Streptococcus parauberis TaxID=1348 RepID=UPI0021A4F9E6|nr:hypothetical protein [Streptococcus parauberis]UWM91251.1 hypothetical protein N2A94_01100 [Streptococcus parauberis]
MNQELFNLFNDQLQKDYGKTASAETFNEFTDYCKEGKKLNGVKPILNWINLYAFGTGITTDEAEELRYERLRKVI